MYTTEILYEGIDYLGITDPVAIGDILAGNEDNIQYIAECQDVARRAKEYENRFMIPIKITKKLLKEKITACNKQVNEWQQENWEKDSDFIRYNMEEMVEYKMRLEARLIRPISKDDVDRLLIAKTVPITNFITFTHNKAKCLWHEEKTGSLHYYPKQNRVHCFGGCGSKDVLDCVMQLQGITLPEAIKLLI